MNVELTNPDRVLYAEQGLTKADLASYLSSVAGRMLPHVEDRPLALVRCPRGQSKQCFFQKHPQGSEPDGIEGVEVPEAGGTGTHLRVRGEDGLIAMAQIGVLEIHVWGSRVDRIDRPDRMVFDLDPAPDLGFAAVKRAARDVRDRLREDGLSSFVMTTGSKGLHVIVPLDRSRGFDDVRRWSQRFAKRMVEDDPERYVAKASKEARGGKIFVDYLRNGLGATAVAPYSMRAKPSAPVATPMGWDELGRLKAADAYTVRNLRRRLASLSRDPWEGYRDAAAPLPTFG